MIIVVAPLVGAWIEIALSSSTYLKKDVAPLVGAWIEIPALSLLKITDMSLPSWERGLKFYNVCARTITRPVAPLVGAWIEITLRVWETRRKIVAPLVGAWIEMSYGSYCKSVSQSLPSWERGLKSTQVMSLKIDRTSLPSWERGLKYRRSNGKLWKRESLPSWERGLK